MPDPVLAEADYEAIETALRETERGRWFLAEHARRNRAAETRLLLQAIEKLERVVRGNGAADGKARAEGSAALAAAAPEDIGPESGQAERRAAAESGPAAPSPRARLDAMTPEELLTLFG
jgi:hypothetical protein